jgi:hypothetical protein
MRILTTFCFCLASVVIGFSQLLEAENGALAGTQVSTQRVGYSGNEYVTGFDADGEILEVYNLLVGKSLT